MSVFLDNAQSILDTAVSGKQNGMSPETMSILVLRDGSLRAVSGADWTLAALEEEYNAKMSYRVAAAGGRVTVEGRMGNEKCVLQSEPQVDIARRLLSSRLLLA